MTATQVPAPTETRAATPRPVVWVELPRTGADRDGDDHLPVYDPSVLGEECERWDGMA